MTSEDRAILIALMSTVNTLQASLAAVMFRVERLEQICVQLGKRMQLQEAGTAPYEIEAVDRRLN